MKRQQGKINHKSIVESIVFRKFKTFFIKYHFMS